MKLHFIRESLVPEFTVRDCCRVLGVSTSGYYRLVKVPVGKREAQARTLNAQVAAVHDACGGIYGSPRVYNELRTMGVKASRKAGIRSRMHRKFRVKTTDSNHTNPIAPNLLNRNFTMDMPNRAWASDVTYIPTLRRVRVSGNGDGPVQPQDHRMGNGGAPADPAGGGRT